MSGPKSITPGAPENAALDFVALREQGVAMLRALAGSTWTDHNAHDPGITILEQLCYALTELAYQADLPVEDLLGHPGSGSLDPARSALFPPQCMLTGAPVTEADYRRLLIDRVPGVGNAWITAGRAENHGGVPGLHEIELYIPDAPNEHAWDRRGAARRARRIFVRHRSLCEDLAAVHVLAPTPARLEATVAVDGSAPPEAVLARVVFEAGLFLAPEVRRRPLDAGVPVRPLTQIFSGPLPIAGFIADDQLTPRVTQVTLGDLTRVLARVEGVTFVRDVQLRTPFGTLGRREAQSLRIPGRRVLQLDANTTEDAVSLRVVRDGAPCRIDSANAARELQRLWTDHRRRFDIRVECDRLLSPPARTPAGAVAYHSVQHHFPDVYGINGRGLPSEASNRRRAQARQLKGYLLVFEHLLADALTRIASARDIFSTAGRAREHEPVRLDRVVPDSAPLLAASYARAVPGATRTGDRPLDRRSRALDVMLAAYGESAGRPLFVPAAQGSRATAAARAAVGAKRRLLRHLPWVAGRRGCGVDYLASSRRGQLVSAEVRSRIQLGMDPDPKPLADLLSRERIALDGTAPQADRVTMIQHARHIDRAFEPLGYVPVPSPGEREWRAITEDLLLAAGDETCYRIGSLPGEAPVVVVCRAPSQPVWQLVGRYAERGAALADVSRLLDTTRRIESRVRRVTLVEHMLLRFGRSAEETPGAPGFENAFTVSGIVALPAREASDPAYRTAVDHVLRANTPAHIVLDVRFLRLSDAAAFEALHGEWRRAIRSGTGRERLAACRRMRAFLQAGG